MLTSMSYGNLPLAIQLSEACSLVDSSGGLMATLVPKVLHSGINLSVLFTFESQSGLDEILGSHFLF